MPRKSSQQILAELEAEDDGLPKRSVGVWSLEKLAVLLLYIEGFAKACKTAGGGYYVDGLAGPGLCKVKNAEARPRIVCGSPLLALRSRPRIEKGIFLELGPRKAEILKRRCAQFGPRVSVHRGDVNRDLVRIVRDEVPPRKPCVCLLDPEGPELDWKTVAGIAGLPGRKNKPELLIIFPLDMAILRLLPVSAQMAERDREQLAAMFGSQKWWDVYQARLRGEISPATAKNLYLKQYTAQVKGLGYRSVQSKPIIAPRRWKQPRKEMYHLVFASDDPTGEKIMNDVFRRPYVLDYPVTQQRPLFEI